ncbi:MAG: hypothetical protein DCC55_30440 [Chloroflexi bacterium]|nr:MAG: hypothetical protein DCC55_30440 [Chloroflexota bacterium]
MPQPWPDRSAALHTFYARYPQLRDSEEMVEDGLVVMEYAQGDRLFNRGRPVTRLFWVLEGEVAEAGTKRVSGRPFRRLRRTVAPGQLLGLYDFLAERRHSTYAIAAVTPTRVLEFGIRSFEKLLYSHQQLLDLFAPLRTLERLRTIPLMSTLAPIERWYVAEAAQWHQFAPGDLLFDASTAGTTTFLIDRGQVQVTGEQGEQFLLGNGAATGLPGLDSTARAVTAGAAFAIPTNVLLQLAPDPPIVDLVEEAKRLRQEAVNTLRGIFPQADVTRLLGFVSHYFLPDPQLLLAQGEQSDSIWVLMPGSHAHVLMPYRLGGALRSTPADGPNTFAEAALTAPAPIPATVAATANSHWLRLHHADYEAYQQLVGRTGTNAAPRAGRGAVAVPRRDFPWLQSGERVLWPSRRHWLVLIRKTGLALLLLALTFIGFTVLYLLPGPQILLTAGVGFVGAGAFALFLWGLYDYWNDYIVVTNRRFVRQEHVFLQSIHLQETGLEQIRNVDIAKSFSGQLLGFGQLRVHTAGPQGTIAFDFVPAVERVQRILIDQMNERRSYREAAGKIDIQQSLEARLGLRMLLPERIYDDEGRAPPGGSGRWSWLEWTGLPLGRREYAAYQQERVVWRKHWLVLFLRLFWPLVWLAGLGLLLFSELLLLLPFVTIPLTGPATIAIALLALIDLGVIAWRFADWRNDTYEVTRDEVADVERLPLFFDEQRRTARLVSIDNIRVEIPGTLHYLLNVGNVRLETAAMQGEFTFDWVGNPNRVAAEVRRRIEEARQREERERARQRARELSDWFELYDRLHVEREGSRG